MKAPINIALALSMVACSPASPDSPVERGPQETVAAVREKMRDYCSFVPSDVDGITCVVTDGGKAVASLYESCWSAKPSSVDSGISGRVVDVISVPDDCEVEAAQF